MLYQVKSYLKFRIKSSNQHGVHSPFVYDLITKCFYDKTPYPEYAVFTWIYWNKTLFLINEKLEN